jgi:hypothetical protein
MTLDELAKEGSPAGGDGAAPGWLWGTFSRRSITFYSGAEDSRTRVLWLQTRGLSADFRFPPDRVQRDGRTSLSEFSDAELLRVAASEGGLSRTHWDGSRMSWYDWAAFQTHAKWAEPGDLRRIGDCVIEFAPSGAYVEDWRAQPSSAGPLIGLRLVAERNLESGEIRYRDGGLIVCGDHAAFVRGRASALPEGKLTDTVAGMLREEVRRTILAFEASYATRTGEAAPFIVEFSTNPLREGEPLLPADGFSYENGVVFQRTVDQGVRVEREFTVDTLAAHVDFLPATRGSDEGRAWLDRESDTLLAHAQLSRPIALSMRF